MNEADALSLLQARIGYRFRNESLLKEALTHSSYANEVQTYRPPDYERLEFLGDAVLEMATSACLYELLPDMREGELTKKRASLVCEEALFHRAAEIGLKECILLGKGEEKSGGRARPSLIADVTEALIGAIYVDGGMDEAGSFIRRFILQHVTSTPSSADYKSELQEYVQGRQAGTLRYVSLDETGPEHAKTFTTAVYLDARMLGEGRGKSKKAAQQQAAQAALQLLRDENG